MIWKSLGRWVICLRLAIANVRLEGFPFDIQGVPARITPSDMQSEERQSPDHKPPERAEPPLLRWLHIGAWVLVALFFLIRFIDLDADFIHEKEYSRDGVLYTDEGWYANNAIHYFQSGEWHYDGDLNFAVNLPTLQVMHAVSFAIFGVNIDAARLTILFSFTVLLMLMYVFVRKWTDKWTALLAVAIVSWNFFFLLFSRFAIAEIPMAMFACVGFLLGYFSKGKLGWLFAVLAGIAWAISFYTKTSALFALPILSAIVFFGNWSPEIKWAAFAKVGAMVAGAAAVIGLHTMFLAIPYRDDFLAFQTINVGMRAQASPGVVIEFFFQMIDKMRLIDPILYRVIKWLPLALVLLVKDYRRNPLVWFCVAWLGIYTVMFSFYVNLKPRYWAPLFVPIAMLIAVTYRQVFVLFNAYWPERKRAFEQGSSIWKKLSHPRVLGWVNAVVLVLFSAALAGSLVRNVGDTADYFDEKDDSFEQMAKDVRERMGDDEYLLGHFTTKLALYVDVLPINDRYATGPLDDRLKRYRPHWLITEDTINRPDSKEEKENNYPGSREDRLVTLKQFYEPIEEVAVYDVFSNYKDYRIHLYKLTPRPELGWDGESPPLP